MKQWIKDATLATILSAGALAGYAGVSAAQNKDPRDGKKYEAKNEESDPMAAYSVGLAALVLGAGTYFIMRKK